MRSVAPSVVLAAVALVFAGGCGGRVDDSHGERLPAPALPAAPAPRTPAPSPTPPGVSAPETIADGVGEPSALAVVGTLAVFTTRSTILEGARVETGGLFVRDTRVGPALMIAVDARGARYDTLSIDVDASGPRAVVSTSDGRLLAISLRGGEPETLAALTLPVVATAVASGSVYFADEKGGLHRVATHGGVVEDLGTVEGGVRGLVVDGEALFVATASSAGGTITRVSLSSEGSVVLTPSDGAPCAMAKGGSRLFWTSVRDAESAVLGISLAGGEAQAVATGSFGACGIVADGTELYFTVADENGEEGGLMRALVGGGEAVRVSRAPGALTSAGTVAADAKHVYWLTRTAVLGAAR